MTVHINGSKGKELYYNGVKIKEAYYNGNKVYSSGPLWYSYTEGEGFYYYFTEEVNVVGKAYQLFGTRNLDQATSSSDLILGGSITPSSITSNGFKAGNSIITRYPSGDLYT